MQNNTKYYNILGVQTNASFKDIKESYRKLSLRYHPDKNQDKDDGKFKEITEAYQILKDDLKKQTQKSATKAESAHADFWNFYEKRAKEEFHFKGNFNEFRYDFRDNSHSSNKPNQEKSISLKSTHLLLYSGLAIVTVWIILTEILK